VPSTFTVTNVLDDGSVGSLRWAVGQANSNPGADTINFAVKSNATITLSQGQLDITDSLTITGPGAGALAVSGNNASRVFQVEANLTVAISGLTIENGLSGWNAAGVLNHGNLTLQSVTVSGNYARLGGDIQYGGGIYNNGTLTVQNSLITDDHADAFGGGGGGGGIYNVGTATITASTISNSTGGDAPGGGLVNYGTMAISSSTISGNSSTWAGGIANMGTLTLSSSTVSGNISGFEAGGILNGGGSGAAVLTITDSTIANNSAEDGGGGIANYGTRSTLTISNSTIAGNSNTYGMAGGGLFSAGTLNLQNTILAGNTDTGGAPDLYGSLTTSGYNLIGSTSGGSGFAATDLLNVNPQLGSLQNNGGPTQTMALKTGSPAINAGDPNYLSDTSNPLLYDQRGPGFNRVAGGRLDIGAYELQAPQPATSFVVSGFPSPVTAGTAGSFTVTALNADGTVNVNYTGTVHLMSSDPQAVLPRDYTFTTADAGVHTFSATLKTAGTQWIAATDTATAITASQTGITVNPAAAKKLVLTAPANVYPGRSFSLTLTVLDAYGNVATGYTGTVRLSSSSRSILLPASYTFTSANQSTATLTATVAPQAKKGKVTITVTDSLDSSIVASVTVYVL
jgi:hypothetical protein